MEEVNMTPKEYEVLQAAAAGSMLMSWFEDPERSETTRSLVTWGYIKKVDLHVPDTGAEPKYYRATEQGKALWGRAGAWDAAKSIALPEV